MEIFENIVEFFFCTHRIVAEHCTLGIACCARSVRQDATLRRPANHLCLVLMDVCIFACLNLDTTMKYNSYSVSKKNMSNHYVTTVIDCSSGKLILSFDIVMPILFHLVVQV